jgi:hypothetical protein
MATNQRAQERHRACIAEFGNLLRSKGFLWIGSPARHRLVGEWSHSGKLLTFSCGGYWMSEYPDGTFPEEAMEKMEKDMFDHEFVFDRRQEIVFIGQAVKRAVLIAALDACLMTDEEFAEYRAICVAAQARRSQYLEDRARGKRAAAQLKLAIEAASPKSKLPVDEEDSKKKDAADEDDDDDDEHAEDAKPLADFLPAGLVIDDPFESWLEPAMDEEGDDEDGDDEEEEEEDDDEDEDSEEDEDEDEEKDGSASAAAAASESV